MWVSPFLACAAGTPTANATATASTHVASAAPNAFNITVVPFVARRSWVSLRCWVGAMATLGASAVAIASTHRSPTSTGRWVACDGDAMAVDTGSGLAVAVTAAVTPSRLRADRRRQRAAGPTRRPRPRTQLTATSTTVADCCWTTRSRRPLHADSIVRPYSGAVCQYVLAAAGRSRRRRVLLVRDRQLRARTCPGHRPWRPDHRQGHRASPRLPGPRPGQPGGMLGDGRRRDRRADLVGAVPARARADPCDGRRELLAATLSADM